MVDAQGNNETRGFLEAWFAACPEGQRLEIRPFREKRAQQQQWCPSVESALAHIERCAANGDDVYIGALPRAKLAGTADAVGARVWLWADIDVGVLGHKRAGRYESFEAALGALKKCGIEPALVVNSGGGIHAWWRLEEAATPEQWSAAITRIAYAVGGDLAVCDAPRILRVPGTHNHKTKPPRAVRLMESSAAVTRLDDVLALPEPRAAPKPAVHAASGALAEGDGAYALANDIPVRDVLDWLGIPIHSEGSRLYCACPVHRGSNTSQMVVGGERNVATCFGDCSGRHFTAIDLTRAVRRCSAREALNALAQRFGFDASPKRTLAAARSATGTWENQLLRSGRGTPKTTIGNMMLALRNDPEFKGRLRFNQMTQIPEFDGVRLVQTDIARLRELFEAKYGMTPGAQMTWEALNAIADENVYHPVKAYLEELEWDGIVRLPLVLTQILGADGNALNQRILRAWFVAAIARAMRPGTKVDNALVLVGPQGYGKSSFFRALGDPWFSDTTLDIERKDAYLQVAGAWIYECQEVEYLTGHKQQAKMKGFMTSQMDTFRKPYEQVVAELKRWCVLVGTTNDEHFLHDPTGARRYWPLRVTRAIDVNQVRAWRDQLWAEAYEAYSSGERFWLASADEEELAKTTEQFRAPDPWEDPILTFLSSARPDVPVTTRNILCAINVPTYLQSAKASHRVAQIMQRHGYRTARKREEDGTVPRVWIKEQSA